MVIVNTLLLERKSIDIIVNTSLLERKSIDCFLIERIALAFGLRKWLKR